MQQAAPNPPASTEVLARSLKHYNGGMGEPLTRADLDEALAGFEERLTKRLDDRINTRIAGLEERLNDRINSRNAALAESMSAHFERFETRLTSAFWSWARPREINQRSLQSNVLVLRDDVNGVEERVTMLEKRLNDKELRRLPE